MRDLIEAIANIPEEPFAKYMKVKGYNPDDGWVLVIPPALAEAFDGSRLPSYVMVSHHVGYPMFLCNKPPVPSVKLTEWVTEGCGVTIRSNPMIIPSGVV